MAGDLLTADQVSQRLGVDKSTIYRMATDGRLAAVKVGRQWRFPLDAIQQVLRPSGPTVVSKAHDVAVRVVDPADGGQVPLRQARQAVLEAAARTLGVMMVFTDMAGTPVTDVVNPCPWFQEHGDEPGVLNTCTHQWRQMAEQADFQPRLELGEHGFECARSFVRDGDRLIGMVLAGGVSPHSDFLEESGLFHLDQADRDRLLVALPRVAAALSHLQRSTS